MAMDALRNLANNIPDWQRRLDDLNGQIEHRQSELAALAGSSVADPAAASAPPRSLRNKGSSESLKPRDDGPMHPDVGVSLRSSQDRTKRPAPPGTLSTPSEEAAAQMPGVAGPPPSSPGSENHAALHQQAREAVAAHARASVQAKKKRRSDSAVSAEGVTTTPACRTRSMIIVYYDSYVQGFFDDLVRFVSSSRNLTRKARMAAKVAQIKRMAELEVANDAKRSSAERFAVDALPSLRYMSARRAAVAPVLLNDQTCTEPRQPGGGPGEPLDVYDSLDKSLEFVQSTCEHSAHQFLRDGDCHDEIRKIQARLLEVLQESREEIDRVQREDPELARETDGMVKARMHRPISVRRDVAAEQKDGGGMGAERENKDALEVEAAAAPASTLGHEVSGTLEIDTDLDSEEDPDELMPRLGYRSTQLMRSGAV